MAGRILANKPSSLRRRKSPASGRTSYGTRSQCGPPTAPKISIGRMGLGHGRVSDRNLVSIVAATADQTFFDREVPQSARIHESDELFHLGHDFRADAIAGEKKELMGRNRTMTRSNALSRLIAKATRTPWQDEDQFGKVRAARATCMSSHRPKVVIVGAGFGGIQAAAALSRVAVDVILLDRQNHHCFQPLLYQ